MYEELVEEFENKREDSLKAETKDLRIASFTHEVSLLRQDNRQKDIYIATFRRELENVVGAFGQKELEAAVKQLYRKYVKGENIKMDVRGGAPKEGSVVQFLLTNDDSDDESDVAGFSVDGRGGGGSISGGGGGGGGRGKNMKKAIIQEIETELIESAKEANRQRQFVERSADNLQHRLRTTKAEAARINRTRLNENSHLIFECNELRKEVKQLTRKLEIANQVILDAQAAQARASANVSAPPPTWEDVGDDDNASDVTANMRKAAAASMRRTDSAGVDSRHSGAGKEIARGLKAADRNAASAVELGGHRVHSGGSQLAQGLSHQNSAPMGLTAPAAVDGGLAVAGSHTQSRPSTGGSQPQCIADPIPRDYVQGAMTVEQRLLRKKDAQIEKLVNEIEALSAQLDDASRERSMQRTELSRLRNLLTKSLANTALPATGALNVRMPKGGRSPPKKSGRLLLSVGMDNGVRCALQSADRSSFYCSDLFCFVQIEYWNN